MQAIVYTRNGDPDVLELVERDVPEPGPGEVRVRIARSGINPTDWKSRRSRPVGEAGFQVPNQDGSGVVAAVGNGVDPAVLGQRVWLWEAAQGRPWGTAAEYSVVPQRQAVLLPANASLDLGACLGVPFLTAHRCLTVGEAMPDRLDPGALAGKTVLVQGGAGGVGNAAIQLARWADARIITTVSGPEKAQLAAAAGADEIINYRTQDVVAEVKKVAPHGVDTIVEVAILSRTPLEDVTPRLPGDEADAQSRYIEALVARPDGAVRVGREAGLPLHPFPLAETAKAHETLEGSPTGRVVVTVADL